MERHLQLKSLARLIIILLFFLSPLTVYSQIAGTFYIDNTHITGGQYFANFTDAITALNTGVTGPVTFNVTHDQVFNENPPVITVAGTITNPVIFQKSGSGANPLISGTGTTSIYDGLVVLAGAGYITFDGIDLKDSGSSIEWGYALLKKNDTTPFIGCQHVVIKNCSISLNRSNIWSVGIYSGDHTYSSPTLALPIISNTDAMNNCSFYNNNIKNVYTGIKLRGDSLAVFPFNLYDQNNSIGVTETGANGPNTITKFGTVQDANTWLIYGIYISYQNNIKINNNIITNDSITGGSSTQFASIYGIYLYNAIASNAEVSANIISLNNANANATTSSMGGIYNLSGGGSSIGIVTIKDNIIHNCNYSSATTGNFAGIQNATNVGNLNISGNVVDSNTYSGTSNFFGIDAGTPFNLNFNNNTITNNSKTNTGTLYSIRINTATGNLSCYSNTTANNFINNQTASTSSSTLYGIYSSASSLTDNVFNNQVNHLSIYSTTSSSIGTVYGMYFTAGNSSGSRSVYNNVINSLYVSNYNAGTEVYGSGYIYGLNVSAVTNTLHVYKNNCFDFTVNSTTATIQGIYVGSGYNDYIYNNFISDLNEPIVNSTNISSMIGLYLSNTNSSSFTGAYYNTIYLNASSSGAEFTSTGANANASAGIIELKNNIVVNNSTPAGTGITYALRRNAVTSTSYSVNTDANNLWAGTPGLSNLLYYDGTNSIQTITELRNLLNTDAHSFSELPPFMNTSTKPYDLRIQAGMPTGVESGGIPVISPVSVATDFYGTTRNSNFTDVGAYEFSGIKNDHAFPLISLTPLLNTSSTSARNFTAEIADASGMPVSGIGLPVLYWKINNGTYNSSTAVYLGGSTYQFTLGTGAVTGNQVSYYIAAQDNAGNVGTLPIQGAALFTVNPPAAGTVPTALFTYSIVNGMSGTYYIGPNEVSPNFIHLKDAVNALNSSAITGPVTFILDSNFVSTGETFPVTFNKNAGSSEGNTVTVKPAAPGIIFSGLANSPATNTILILVNGMSYLTIDGSSNGTSSRDLTISNNCPNGGSTVIYISSLGVGKGATHVTIKNCNLNGTVKSSDYVIKLASQNPNNVDIGENNDYCTITNNMITRAFHGIYVGGSAWGKDSGLKILNNKISSAAGDSVNSIAKRGIYLRGCIAPVISGNEISNMVYAFQTGNNLTGMAGIELSDDIIDGEISGNKIFNLKSLYLGNQHVTGILIGSGNSITITGMMVYNNFISGISNGNYGTLTSLQNSPCGIKINSAGEIKVYFNSINMNGVQTPTGLSGIPSAAFAIDGGNSSTMSYGIDLRNNLFINTMGGGISGSKYYTVFVKAQGSVSNIDYNDYYAPSGAGLYGVLGYWWGNDIISLSGPAGLQSMTNQDQHSKSDTVFFVSSNDLHLTGSSVGDTTLVAAMISGITTDIDGDTRFHIPYMGADEVLGHSLPVELSSFDIKVNNRDITLYWKTSTEKNSFSFIIEKSSAVSGSAFSEWNKINEIRSAGTSTSEKEYSCTDRALSPGKVRYRIRMVDYDGSYTYSKTVETEILSPKEFYLSQNYPNPFNPSCKIDYHLPVAASVTIDIFNITGQRIAELVNKEQTAGYYTIEINSGTIKKELASGVYFYRITAVDKVSSGSFVNVKKMIVLK